MNTKKSTLWTTAKYVVLAIIAFAIVGALSENGAVDDRMFWPFVGMAFVVYMLARDIDKLRRRIESLERARWRQDDADLID
jgi:uncharacterized membrane protein YoaK (UPF0700 family)